MEVHRDMCGPSHRGDHHSRQTEQSWLNRALHEGPVPETGCQKRLVDGLQREPVKGMCGCDSIILFSYRRKPLYKDLGK